MADKARSRELPDHSLHIVTKRLIKISIEQWDDPCHELLEKVYDILAKKVNKMLDDRFHRFQYGGLHQRVKTIVNDVLFECQESGSQKIEWLLVMENGAPFTLNNHYFKDYREKFLKSYREARRSPEAYNSPTIPRPLILPTRLVTEESPLPELEKSIAQDPYDQALHHMASARAYFQVAFKRFTDMVPMTIDQELLRGLDWGRGLQPALTKGLGITGPGSQDRAMGYLQDPPEIRNRRESLLKKRERLQSARRELHAI